VFRFAYSSNSALLSFEQDHLSFGWLVTLKFSPTTNNNKVIVQVGIQLDFLGDILSTFTIALLTPARGGNRCDSVCSAVHRLTIPLELISNQPSLSL
jgi:hypothetical protein